MAVVVAVAVEVAVPVVVAVEVAVTVAVVVASLRAQRLAFSSIYKKKARRNAFPGSTPSVSSPCGPCVH